MHAYLGMQVGACVCVEGLDFNPGLNADYKGTRRHTAESHHQCSVDNRLEGEEATQHRKPWYSNTTSHATRDGSPHHHQQEKRRMHVHACLFPLEK